MKVLSVSGKYGLYAAVFSLSGRIIPPDLKTNYGWKWDGPPLGSVIIRYCPSMYGEEWDRVSVFIRTTWGDLPLKQEAACKMASKLLKIPIGDPIEKRIDDVVSSAWKRQQDELHISNRKESKNEEKTGTNNQRRAVPQLVV